jgi:hypothetical protein
MSTGTLSGWGPGGKGPVDVSYDESIRRIGLADLRGLAVDGRACEVCCGHMHDHQWADLDSNGFVVACSEQTQEQTP